jgi:hypothetical protein
MSRSAEVFQDFVQFVTKWLNSSAAADKQAGMWVKQGGFVPPHDAQPDDGQRDSGRSAGTSRGNVSGRGPGPDADRQRIRSYGLASIGFEFAAAFVLPTLLGFLADRWLKTAPWLMIVGATLGFAVGIMQMVRIGRRGS